MKYTVMGWPVWQRSVVMGLVYLGTLVIIEGVVVGYPWAPTLVGGLVGTIIFVTVMTLVMARAEKALNPIAGPPLTADERIEAVRAVDRGQPSDTPRVQMAAVALARQRVRRRISVVLLAVLLGIIALIVAAFAVLVNPWWWLLATVVVVSAASCIAELRHQHKGAITLLAAVEQGTAGQ
jgi:hypothetical protein